MNETVLRRTSLTLLPRVFLATHLLTRPRIPTVSGCRWPSTVCISPHAGEETQSEEFDLWSPASAANAAARASASGGGWTSSTTGFAGAANDDDREEENRQTADKAIDRLKEEIKNLEQANNALKEELVEARLETTALRHVSLEHGEAVLDNETRELRDGDQQGLSSNGSAPHAGRKPGGIESDEAGVYQGDGEEGSIRSAAVLSGGTDTRGPAAPAEVSDTYEGGDGQEEQADQERAENPNAFVSQQNISPETLLRRLSSSAFKDAEEQRELIEALRDQISQLQLEKQMRVAHTTKANNTGGGGSAVGQHDGVAGKLSGCSRCSSDDDSGSGRDDGEGEALGEYLPRSWCAQHIDDSPFGEEDACRRRKKRDDDGVGSSREYVDPAQDSLLQAPESELSAELEAANKVIEALREQAHQNQAEGAQLRVSELSAELDAANKAIEALREAHKNQAENAQLRGSELSAELEVANKAIEALREQAQRNQEGSLELRVSELSVELEAANKVVEDLRVQAQWNQEESAQLRVGELSAELDAANTAIEALREQAQRNQEEGLELRVSELSVELEAANKSIEALREAHKNQAESAQLRVSELSAELEAANKANEALREQAQQNQAESLDLQRELLRHHGARDNRSLMAAAVAGRTYPGEGGEGLEHNSSCLNCSGMGWLRWIWVTVFRGRDGAEEGVGSRIEGSAHDDTSTDVGGELGDGVGRRGSYRSRRGSRMSVDDRELLLARDNRTMGR